MQQIQNERTELVEERYSPAYLIYFDAIAYQTGRVRDLWLNPSTKVARSVQIHDCVAAKNRRPCRGMSQCGLVLLDVVNGLQGCEEVDTKVILVQRFGRGDASARSLVNFLRTFRGTIILTN